MVVVSVLLAIVVLTLVYMRINWVVIKILWIPLVLVGLVLRSLWITIPEPDGMKLEREQAPAECGALQGDVQCVVAEAADRFSVQLYGLVTLSPVTMASVLCAKRTP
jgi:hypothetical protein